MSHVSICSFNFLYIFFLFRYTNTIFSRLLQAQVLALIIALWQGFCLDISESRNLHEVDGVAREERKARKCRYIGWIKGGVPLVFETLTCATFPIDGYQPLQEPKMLEASQADVLLRYVDRLVSIMVDDDKVRADGAAV